MKAGAMMSLVWAAMLIPTGCDRKPPESEPSKYDPEFDGPPLTVAVYSDPLLLADQRKISAAAAASGAPASAGPRTAPAPKPDAGAAPPKADENTTPPRTEDVPAATVMEIKAAIDGYAAALKHTENLDKLRAFIAEDRDVKAARELLEKTAALAKKEEALRQLVKDKLGVELPPRKKAPVGLPGSQLQAAKDNLKFARSADAVLVTGPRGMKATFVRADNRWKLRYGAMDRKMLGVSVKVVEATDGAMDEVKTGIEDGTITRANFEAKMAAIAKEKIDPVLEKMMDLMVPKLGGGGRPAPPGPGTGLPDEGGGGKWASGPMR